MKNNKEQVRLFFDRIHSDYATRNRSGNAIHSYFFKQRLDIALDGFQFSGKRVLDIGAGTGTLYDAITARETLLDYYAIDISEKMLGSSSIPVNRRLVGNCYEFKFDQKFDFVFMLGVTTYMDEIELEKTFDFVINNLKSDGFFIVTYTNNKSIGLFLYKISKGIARSLKLDQMVIGQEFSTYYTSIDILLDLLNAKNKFVLHRHAYLNQTIFPLNMMFQRLSIMLAQKIAKIKNDRILSLFSSDFIVFLKPRL